jgi:acyl-CoA synthetase (AMP-forming)/AMP-acid ligase II
VICAVIEQSDQAKTEGFDQTSVIGSVSDRLAKYKTPRLVVLVDTIGRSPAGKVDYKSLTTQALADLHKRS